MNKIDTLNSLTLNITDGKHGDCVDEENSGFYFVSSKDVFDGEIHLEESRQITKADYEETNKRTRLEPNDILITNSGSIGRLCFLKPTDKTYGITFQKSVAVIKPNAKKVYPKYLYYNFSYNVSLLVRRAVGSNQKNLLLSDLRELELKYHDDKTVQKEIAEVLTAIDEKMFLNYRINNELETMVRTIYNYWFVQFDFPNEVGEPYKSGGGKMEWSEELKKEIPQGWEVNKLGTVLRTVLGGTPATVNRDYWDSGNINWLNSGEVAAFPVVSSELKITEEAIRSSATELLHKGSVLLSITRHLRPTILAIDACANQSVVGITEKGEMKSYFLYPYLVNEIPRLMTLRTGAQQPHINKEIIDESLIITPNKGSYVLAKYNESVEALYKKIITLAFETKELSTLRDFLLPLLMNGQVKVIDF